MEGGGGGGGAEAQTFCPNWLFAYEQETVEHFNPELTCDI